MLLCNAASSTSALTRFDFGGLVSRRLHDLRSLFSRLTHKAPRLRLQFNDLVSRGFQIRHMAQVQEVKTAVGDDQQGDSLLVGLNGDESVRQLKGPDRFISIKPH